MALAERIRALFRLFLLFTFLVVVAMVSAITTIRLTIRGHQEATPKFVGMPVSRAQQIASTLGLEMKIEDKVFSSNVPANAIVSQMPLPGTPIKVGQHVHILVSLGPPAMAVPNLVGDSLRAARITAIQRGLAIGDVVAVHWPGAEPDRVVVQDPPAANSEVHSPAVNLLVSLGQEPQAYLCPSFVGQPLEHVRRTLEKAGFQVGDVIRLPGATASSGTVLAQSPPPGGKIDSQTVFTFQVAE